MFAYALQSRPKRAAGLPMVIVMLLQAPQFPGAHSALDPAGPQAAAIKDWLWDPMLAAALVTFVLVTAALLGAAFRRRPTGESPDDVAYEPRLARAVGAATALTVVVLFAVLIMDGTVGHAASGAPPDALRIRVTGISGGGKSSTPTRCPRAGHDRQRDSRAGRAAGGARAPLDRRHPQLLGAEPEREARSHPGRLTHLWLQADRPGVYRGLCAEFCGPQHAKMALLVIAEPPTQFDAMAARAQRAAGRRCRAMPAQTRAERCSSADRARCVTRSAARRPADASDPT